MTAQPIPNDYHRVTPYLIVRNAAEAIEFYRKALGATEAARFTMPNGKIGHAEIRIGDAAILLADEVPEMEILGPESLGGSPVNLLVYVEDVDAVFARAVEAGATVRMEIQDQFYGDRSGCLTDPFGHHWTLATRKEDVSLEEQQRRFKEFLEQQSADKE